MALESVAGFGESILIQIVSAGDLLGWSWMFPPYVWQFTARAIEPTTALFLRGNSAGILREGPLVRLRSFKRISAVMVRRLQAAHDKAVALFLSRVSHEPPIFERAILSETAAVIG